MKTITVASDPSVPGFILLKTSCAVNNLELVTLLSQEGAFNGNRDKDILLADYLSELDPDELILFTDAYDAVFMAGEEEIQEKYRKIGKRILFSAESNCHPDKDLSIRYPKIDDSPFCYLNSGGFMGPAGAIREALLAPIEIEEDKYPASNQYLWTFRYFNDPETIGLDTNCEIFASFLPEVCEYLMAENTQAARDDYFAQKVKWFHQNFTIENHRIYDNSTGRSACHAHFNGVSKCLLYHYPISEMVFSKIPGADRISYRRMDVSMA